MFGRTLAPHNRLRRGFGGQEGAPYMLLIALACASLASAQQNHVDCGAGGGVSERRAAPPRRTPPSRGR